MIFPTIEKTGRKPCCIIEQIIGIALVSKRDFDKLTLRSSIHNLKIQVTSHPCNKYEQIMLSCLLCVK